MIVLDTNIIEPFKTLDGPAIDLLRALSRTTKQTIRLPQMVVDEYMAHRVQDIQDLIDQARAANERLARKVSTFEQHEYPNAEREARPLHDRLLALSDSVLLNEPGDAAEAFGREMKRRAPASRRWKDDAGKSVPGFGARDVMVWLPTRRAAQASGETVYFVSNDKNAFGGDAGLLPELKAEVNYLDCGDKLVLCNSVDALLAELAAPQKLDGISPVDLANAEQVQSAVSYLFRRAASYGVMTVVEAEGVDAEAIQQARTAPQLMRAPEKAHAYRVSGKLWATFRGSWESTLTFGISPAPTAYRMQIGISVSLLAELDDAGRDIQRVEVLESRPWQVGHLQQIAPGTMDQ